MALWLSRVTMSRVAWAQFQQCSLVVTAVRRFQRTLNEFQLQTVYWTLFWDFGADKTCTTRLSGGRVQIWVQVLGTSSPLQSSGNHSQRLSRRQSMVLTAKSMAKLLGAPAQLGPVGRASTYLPHRALQSRRQSLRTATSSLAENVLPILQYWLSSRVNKVLMLCKSVANEIQCLKAM